MTPQLQAALAKVVADHDAVLGHPPESRAEVLWEEFQRASATDQAVVLEDDLADGLTSVLAALLPELCPADAPFAAGEAKVLNWLLHRAIENNRVRAKAAQAQREGDALKQAGE